MKSNIQNDFFFVFSSPQQEPFIFTEGAGPCFYRGPEGTNQTPAPFMLFMTRGVQLVADLKHITRCHHTHWIFKCNHEKKVNPT